MTLTFYSDGNRQDHIANFYNVDYATYFVKGVMDAANNVEQDTMLTVVLRQGDSKNDQDNALNKFSI